MIWIVWLCFTTFTICGYLIGSPLLPLPSDCWVLFLFCASVPLFLPRMPTLSCPSTKTKLWHHFLDKGFPDISRLYWAFLRHQNLLPRLYTYHFIVHFLVINHLYHLIQHFILNCPFGQQFHICILFSQSDFELTMDRVHILCLFYTTFSPVVCAHGCADANVS